MTPPSPSDKKDTTTGAAEDATLVVNTVVKAVYNLEAETACYPDPEEGVSVTMEEDSVSASGVEELADQGLGLPV